MRTKRTVSEVGCKQVHPLIILIAMFLFPFSTTGCFNNDSPEKGARLWINAALNSDVQVFGQRTASNSWDSSAQDVKMHGTFSTRIMDFDVFVKGLRAVDDVFQSTEGSVNSDRYVYKLEALSYKAQKDGQSLWVTVSGYAHLYDEIEKKNIGESSLFPAQLRMIKESGVWKCDSWVWQAGTGN